LELSIRGVGVSREFLENLCTKRELRIVSLDLAENRATRVQTYRLILNGRGDGTFYEMYQDLTSIEDVQSIQLTGHTLR
jgi:hypothetical protein